MRTFRSIISLVLCICTVLSVVSCGRKYIEYDPGYFAIDKSNYNDYFKLNLPSGKEDLLEADSVLNVNYSISAKQKLEYEDCYITVKFTANEGETTKSIALDETGSASGGVSIEFEMAYSVKYDCEIIDVSGIVFDGGPEDNYKNRNITKYFVHNNIRYESRKFLYEDETFNTWVPMYSKKNNTKTLYFTDVVYTKSGTPVVFEGMNMFSKGYDGGIFSGEKPMKKVKTIIIDGSVAVSAFEWMGWSNIHKTFPNLETVYIKDVVCDKNQIDARLSLPTSGVDFYIGGDSSVVEAWLSEGKFVNSIQSANEFNIDDYDQDNKR